MTRSYPEPSDFRPTDHPLGIRCAPFGGGSGPHPTVVAPDHALLRGRIEPQVDTRLTALAELRHASFTNPCLPRSGSDRTSPSKGRRHLTAALSTTCEVDELPLTFPVAPRARSGFWPIASRVMPRTAPAPSSSKPVASSIQNAFRRRMLLEGPLAFAKEPRPRWYVGSRSPPPISRLRRRDPASGAFSPRWCALAPRG